MKKVILKVPHTHEGKQLDAGSEFSCDDDTAAWLVAAGGAEILESTKAQKVDKQDFEVKV